MGFCHLRPGRHSVACVFQQLNALDRIANGKKAALLLFARADRVDVCVSVLHFEHLFSFSTDACLSVNNALAGVFYNNFLLHLIV